MSKTKTYIESVYKFHKAIDRLEETLQDLNKN
ncbi:hypothetical protein IMSAG044_01724 [Lactobacillaceae bacterium]|nr:hypothetical protein IMSAG044_01724 [Lactobacillaceae bacterium]